MYIFSYKMITLKKLKTTFYLFKLQIVIKYHFSKSGAKGLAPSFPKIT